MTIWQKTCQFGFGTSFASFKKTLITQLMSYSNVTKDFQGFVDSIDMNYHEIYEFYQASVSNTESISLFRVEPANGSKGTMIVHEPMNIALRLTPDAAKFLPEWIESNLMEGMDAESFYGMKYAQERDEEREAKGLD